MGDYEIKFLNEPGDEWAIRGGKENVQKRGNKNISWIYPLLYVFNCLTRKHAWISLGVFQNTFVLEGTLDASVFWNLVCVGVSAPQLQIRKEAANRALRRGCGPTQLGSIGSLQTTTVIERKADSIIFPLPPPRPPWFLGALVWNVPGRSCICAFHAKDWVGPGGHPRAVIGTWQMIRDKRGEGKKEYYFQPERNAFAGGGKYRFERICWDPKLISAEKSWPKTNTFGRIWTVYVLLVRG